MAPAVILHNVVFYARTLALLAQHHGDDPEVQRGKQLGPAHRSQLGKRSGGPSAPALDHSELVAVNGRLLNVRAPKILQKPSQNPPDLLKPSLAERRIFLP
jgi:hypothetical protein